MSDEPPPVLKLNDLFQVSGWQQQIPWKPFQDAVEIYRLYGNGGSGPAAALLRFPPGGRVALHEHTGYEHIFVLAGSQVDENSRAETGALIINPPGSSHSIVSENGCIVLAIYEKPARFLNAAPREPGAAPPGTLLLAVNGTLMRGLELNSHLLAAGATFLHETKTEPSYRLWSINDVHPAMMRTGSGGVAVTVEIWAVPPAGLAGILLREPAGLAIGRVALADGSTVLGIVAEPSLCEGQKDISEFGGWRNYLGNHAVGG